MYYNAIANNGKMMRPMLVTAIQQNGKDVHIFKPEVIKSSIANKKVLEDIKSALHDVVWDNAIGTASVNKWKQPKAQSKIVSIAGKTGTAQLIINKKPSPYRHRMTFVGYFPEDNPQYTCLCMIEDPKPARTYDAGMDCGSTVRKIAEKTMAYTGCFVFQDGKCVLEKRN
jgi:cell division protein FtsI (penicillin-binding protein 3)